MAEDDDKKPFRLVQLRVPLDDFAALQVAGRAAGRSVPGEVLWRLERYAAGNTPPRVIGEMAEMLTRDAVWRKDDPLQPGVLGAVKLEFGRLLDALGAREVDEGDLSAVLAHATGLRILHWLKSPDVAHDEPLEVTAWRDVLAPLLRRLRDPRPDDHLLDLDF